MSSHMQPRNRTPVLALLTANTISDIGNFVALLAIPWFVLETTGSAAKTGLAGFFTVLPVVLAGFLGGAIVDRLGHRLASIVADLLSGVTVAMIPLLHVTVGLSLWQLLTLVFLGALLDLPGSTARQSLVPELAELAKFRLERVNGAYQSINQVSFLLGPLIAGILIALIGPAQVLWLDAATFALSAILVATRIPAGVRAADPDAEPAAGYLADLVEGWQFIRRERVIFPLTVANALSNFIGPALFTVVLPVYASQVFGNAVDLGLMLSGAAVGSLCSALLYGAIGHRLSRRWLYTGSWLLGAVPYWVLAGTPPLTIAIATLLIMGLAHGPINPLMYTLSQERTPMRLRGRVFGTRVAMANTAAPLGMLSAGILIERIGLSPTLVVMAMLQTMVALYVLAGPNFRALDVPESQKLAGAAERSGARVILRPEWRLLGLALLLLGSGVGVYVVGDGAADLSLGLTFAGILVVAGWVLVGVALRPQGSRRLGAGVAAGVYILVGVIVAGIVALPQSRITAEELVPAVDGYSAIVAIALLWPLAAARLANIRAEHE